MAGPWEQYAAPAAEQGPWMAYAAPVVPPPTTGSEASTRAPIDPARMSLNEFGTPLASSLFGQGRNQPLHPQAIEPGKPFGILPLTQDAQGGVHFDINAGLPGAFIRAVRAPYDAMTGQFDPMSPEGQARAREAAAFITPVNPAVRAGDLAIPGELLSTRRMKPKVPTAQELKNAAGEQYDAARATGAQYPGQTVAAAAEGAQRGMESEGILAELAPQTFSIVRQLQNPPNGAVVTIQSLDAARKALNRVAGNFQNPTEQEAARRVIQRIDELISGAGEGAAPAGAGGGVSVLPPSAGEAGAANGAGLGGGMASDPAQMEAARLIKDARGNAAANFRSDRITGKVERAEDRAGATASGQNIGNALRQRLADILGNDKLSRGFSPEEIDAMRQVVRGTATSNTIRRVSNMLGGGGGLGQTMLSVMGAAAGANMDGLTGATIGGAIPPLLGAATRSGYNALARRQVNKLDELVRQRSPLYQQRAATAPLLPMRSDQATGLLLRGLLMGQPGGLLDEQY